MVAFSTHEYRFKVSESAKWLDLLQYLYGPTFATQHTSLLMSPTVSQIWPSMKLQEIAPRLAKFTENAKTTKSTDSPDGKDQESRVGAATVVVNLGRRWIGLVQDKVLPDIPTGWISDSKRADRVAARLAPNADAKFSSAVKLAVDCMSSIVHHYKRGQEIFVRRAFAEPVAKEDLADLFHALTPITKAFYDPDTHEFFVHVANGIVMLSCTEIGMGHDIDFDIDDGFGGSQFDSRSYDRWNRTHFQAWVQAGRPHAPVLPWLA